MKVDILDALLSTAVLFGVGNLLYHFNKAIIEATSYVVFGRYKWLGVREERRRRIELERIIEEEEDQKKCTYFEPPPVQVIDDVGKKPD